MATMRNAATNAGEQHKQIAASKNVECYTIHQPEVPGANVTTPPTLGTSG
jgi:hypothetical protein